MGVPWPEIWGTSVIGSAFAEVLVESKLSYLGKKNTEGFFQSEVLNTDNNIF